MIVQLFSDNELYPATWVMPIDDDDAHRVGQCSEQVDLPDDLAERALTAWREFRAVGRELDALR